MSILDDNILENTAIDPTKGFPMIYEYGDFGYDWRNPLYFKGTEYETGIKVKSKLTMDNVLIPGFGYDDQERCHIIVYKIIFKGKEHHEYYTRTKNIVINTDDIQIGIRTAYLYLYEIQKNRDVLYFDKDQEHTLINCLYTKATEIEQYNKEHDPWYGFKED